MRIRRVLAAAIAALVIAPGAAQAARAELRVITPTGSVVGPAPALSGAARTYVDDKGATHALARDTVMGQLVAASYYFDFHVGVTFSSPFGGFVSRIAGISPGASGFWALYVNDVASQTGADTTKIHRGDEVTWVLDPDFNKPGPAFLDLDVVRRSGNRITFGVTKAGLGKPAPAAGARVRINGKAFRANARGRVTVRVFGGWTARATLAGALASERLASGG